MLRQRSTPLTEAGLVGLVVLTGLAFAISDVPILNGDEARFAQASREMFVNQDWVVPTFGGEPRYDKPILIYWAAAASFRLFGVTPFAARLPSAVAAAICAALLAWSARNRWGPGSGLAAGLCLAASPIFFFEGQACTADALNVLWTTAAMLALERLMTGKPSHSASAVFWICTGAAVLTKGPVAPLFIISILIGIWALDRHWRLWECFLAVVLLSAGALKFGPSVLFIPALAAATSALRSSESRSKICAWRWQWGVPIFLVITLPWAIKAWQRTSGEFFAVAVGRHVIERGQSALEGHSGFPGFYVITAFVLCFPWFVVALQAGIDAWRLRRNTPSLLFLLAWAIGPLFTLEMVRTKLVHYWLPSYPALILLAVGFVWNLSSRRPDPIKTWWPLTGIHLVGGFFLAAIPIIPVVVFGLEDLFLPAFFLAVLLAASCIISVTMLDRWPRVFLLVIPTSVFIFLTLMLGPFLLQFSDSLIGTRATTVALDHLENGRTVALYGLRDEEILFSLPSSTDVCRSHADLHAAIQRDRNTVFCAREKDYLQDFDSTERSRYLVVDSVEGLDLGRGRNATTVFFRLARPALRESRRRAEDQSTIRKLLEPGVAQ